MNSEIKRLGLLMVLWVARVLLSGKLTNEEQEELERIRVALNVVDWEREDD